MPLTPGATRRSSRTVAPLRWLALLAIVGTLFAGSGVAQSAQATLVSAVGVVVVHADGQAETGRSEMPIGAGDRIETRRGGAATIRFADASEIVLGAETTLDLKGIEQRADGSLALTANQSRGVSTSRAAPQYEADLRIAGAASGGVAILRQGGMILRTDGDSGNVTLACDSRTARVSFPYEDTRVRCEEDALRVFTATQEIFDDTVPSGVPPIVAVFNGDLVGREHGTTANREPEEKEAIAHAGVGGREGPNAVEQPPTGGIGVPPPPTPTPLPTVPNNAFGNAIALPLPGTSIADTRAATVELGEPSPSCGLIDKTVWYRVTPTSAGTLTVSTAGSNFDTLIAVYVGPSLELLSLRACNDDAAGGGVTSRVTVNVTAGQTYFIQAGGHRSVGGSLLIQVSIQ